LRRPVGETEAEDVVAVGIGSSVWLRADDPGLGLGLVPSALSDRLTLIQQSFASDTDRLLLTR